MNYHVADVVTGDADDVLDAASAVLARIAKMISADGAWDERWLDTWEDPPVEHTYGGAIAHVITHSMHHRAQLLCMRGYWEWHRCPKGMF